jgi:ketosteroid isomerase-like protein
MSDWRVDMARRSYEAFKANDADTLLEIYRPDAEWEMGQWGAAFGDDFEGHKGVLAVLALTQDVLSDWDPQIEELRLREDGAVLIRASGSASSERMGAMLDVAFAQIIEFRDGQIQRVTQSEFPPDGWDGAEPVG